MRATAEKKAEIAIIGGTGLEELLGGFETVNIEVPYGVSHAVSIGEIQGRRVAFLPRHGWEHNIPPHKVNYRANICVV